MMKPGFSSLCGLQDCDGPAFRAVHRPNSSVALWAAVVTVASNQPAAGTELKPERSGDRFERAWQAADVPLQTSVF
jgi:hypothetical protein